MTLLKLQDPYPSLCRYSARNSRLPGLLFILLVLFVPSVFVCAADMEAAASNPPEAVLYMADADAVPTVSSDAFDLSVDAISDNDRDASYEGIIADLEPAEDSSVIMRGYKKFRAKASEGAPLYVMIGDSYGTQEPRLADILAGEMHLTGAGGDYYCYFCGGYGVARSDRNRNFLRLLKRLPSNKAVTDVLILGGIYNDRRATRAEIDAAFAELAETARQKYPDARLICALPNWHSNDYRTSRRYRALKYQQMVLTRTAWYRKACADNGIHFLKNVGNTLKLSNNQRLFKWDGHHPNRLGTKRLARAIARAIRKLDAATGRKYPAAGQRR